METYLRLKKRTTYFRKRIPDTLRPLLGLNEVNVRLGVINRSEAEVRGLHLASEFTRLFAQARSGRIADIVIKEEFRRIVSTTRAYLQGLSDQHDARMAADGVGFGGGVPDKVRIECETAAQLVERYDRRLYAFDADFVKDRLREAGITDDTDPVERQKLAGRFTLALALNMFEGALASARRNDLQETDKLPLSRWARQADALRLELSEPAAAEP